MAIKVFQFKSVLPTDLSYRFQFVNINFVGTILPDVPSRIAHLPFESPTSQVLAGRFQWLSASWQISYTFMETPSEVSGVIELRVDSSKDLILVSLAKSVS